MRHKNEGPSFVFRAAKDATFVVWMAGVFGLSVLGLALMSAFSEYLAEFDRGIARWAQGTTSAEQDSYAMNVGLVRFINDHVDSFFFYAIITATLLILYDVFCLGLKGWKHLHHYLYLAVGSMVVYWVSYFLVELLKETFSRPRPLQTTEFHPLFDTAIECLVPFQPAFQVYTGENPCNYALVSMPSGHVQTMVGHMFAFLYLGIYNLRYTGTVKRSFNKPIHLVLIMLAACCCFVFVPTVMFARMAVLRHHFTDVVAGALCTLVCTPVLLAFEPAPLEVESPVADVEETEPLIEP